MCSVRLFSLGAPKTASNPIEPMHLISHIRNFIDMPRNAYDLRYHAHVLANKLTFTEMLNVPSVHARLNYTLLQYRYALCMRAYLMWFFFYFSSIWIWILDWEVDLDLVAIWVQFIRLFKCEMLTLWNTVFTSTNTPQTWRSMTKMEIWHGKEAISLLRQKQNETNKIDKMPWC